MRMDFVAIVSCWLIASSVGGCQNRPKDVKRSADVVSEMATAAAKGDYVGGIALGESYLHDNPDDVYVLEQTAILALAQAKQDQKDGQAFVARAVLLLERSVKTSESKRDDPRRFSDLFIAARGFESAGDLSSHKCPYYLRALKLNDEAGMGPKVEVLKSRGVMSTKPLKEQIRKLRSELEKRIMESRCGSE